MGTVRARVDGAVPRHRGGTGRGGNGRAPRWGRETIATRILHVIASTNSTGGGPIEGIRQTSIELQKNGHVVEVASVDSPSAGWLQDFPLTVHPLGPGILHYQYSPRLKPWLADHAARYDVVIINGIWNYHSFGAWQILRKTGTPYFVFTHGMLDPWFKRTYPLKHVKKWLYWPWADYQVLKDARAVLFTSEEERLRARQSFWLYRCNEIVVGYGTAGPMGDARVQRELFFARFPALRGKRVLLFLGRIHPKKGLDMLIDAFASVADQHPDLHLLVAGPDQRGWEAVLRQKTNGYDINGKLTWAGMLTGDLKWGAFRVAEAFVLPSHQENFGVAVAEAMACGVPVLVSNQVNIWREIAADRAGLVADDTPSGTRELLGRWLRLAPLERQAMGEGAIHAFRERFDVASAAKGLMDVLVQQGGQAR